MPTIKKLLLILLALNLFDGAATYIGLHFQLIEESNPLMQTLYDLNPIIFLTFKVSISFLLFWFIMSKQLLQSMLLKAVSIVAVTSYTFVSILHIYWIYHYFS
ncbi:hypothetical protein FIU87_14035 [Bacillus sp. THAF10]|uniref:DUF5658 family protein n=1 Tax=Bacillus sp. THAF10 TaxID=2587848 RepID=UPI001268B324|nr:DUF5658 family protein [Bacillus sp. THAF10]QFT89778.1 hypothetical protein FIU87_14035 [Bacillus sp. THAF10]